LPALALPWSVMALVGVTLPLVRSRRVRVPWKASSVWFAWWWVVGNLAVFTTWAVAKPNYFVPCYPGLALLVGMAWIRLNRVARTRARSAAANVARLLLQAQWLMLLLVGILTPLLTPRYLPDTPRVWTILLGGSVASGMGLGWWIWRSGRDALALMPFAAACALGVLIGYGVIAPTGNAARGHRRLAEHLDRLVSREIRALHFFHEIDEGLWFYLRRLLLAPVPGSQPRYSDSFDRLGQLIRNDLASGQFADPSIALRNREKQLLLQWLERHGRAEPYILVRETLYERLASDLAGLVTPVYCEEGLKRTNLILLRACGERPRVAGPVMSEQRLQ
jgi:hypothetical protein